MLTRAFPYAAAAVLSWAALHIMDRIALGVMVGIGG